MSKIKDALKRYQAAAKTAQEKQRQARELYQPDAAERECSRIAAWLDGERNQAKAVIDSEQDTRLRDLDAWKRLDGGKITDDVKLLDNNLVTVDQFPALVDKYRDNATMCAALAGYANRRNADARKQAAAGTLPGGLYPVEIIPTAEARADAISKTAAGAYGVINMIDNGFTGFGGGADSPMVTAAVDGFKELF